MSEMPPNPFSQLAAAATATHEMFAAYIDAGFTRAEALHLVTAIMVAATQNAPRLPPAGRPDGS